MLREIDRQLHIIHIAGEEYRVRFCLNALLCLEELYRPVEDMSDPREWTREDILQFARAAMCSLPANYPAVNRRDFLAVMPDIAELEKSVLDRDLISLAAELAKALAQAFPSSGAAPEAANPPAGKRYYSCIGHTKAIFCDEMGNSDAEWWRSTYREIDDRINYYMEAKGLKERPVIVREFDDD